MLCSFCQAVSGVGHGRIGLTNSLYRGASKGVAVAGKIRAVRVRPAAAKEIAERILGRDSWVDSSFKDVR